MKSIFVISLLFLCVFCCLGQAATFDSGANLKLAKEALESEKRWNETVRRYEALKSVAGALSSSRMALSIGSDIKNIYKSCRLLSVKVNAIEPKYRDKFLNQFLNIVDEISLIDDGSKMVVSSKLSMNDFERMSSLKSIKNDCQLVLQKINGLNFRINQFNKL